LWVVGEGDRSRFEAVARRAGVSEAVRFHGSIPNTQDVYRAADMFVLPSLYEAFSLVTLEAASSALPIIVCEGVSGVAELIADTDAGLIVPRQPQAFAAALVKLAVDHGQRVRMGESARRRALAFSWDNSANQVRALYRSLLGAA
jgi:glycosyltransferase involved in cell wall biosynthesis